MPAERRVFWKMFFSKTPYSPSFHFRKWLRPGGHQRRILVFDHAGIGEDVPSTWITNALCLLQSSKGWNAARHNLELADGLIVGLHSEQTPPTAGSEIIDGHGLLATPGLINCHSHSPDNLNRGVAPDLPLELWSLYSSAGRETRTSREIYVSVLLGAIEMMGTGTTCVLDHVRISPDLDDESLDAVAQAWHDSGMRVTIAPIVSDRRITDTMPFVSDDLGDLDLSSYGTRRPLSSERQMEIAEAFFIRWHGSGNGRIRVAIGPSGPQRCSDDLLLKCADFSARHDSLLHTHVLETRIQREMGYKLYGKGMIGHLRDIGLLTRRTNLVHSIWLDDGDIDLIGKSGASVIHNPVSNARLGSGFCPLPALLDAGIRVGLGTDSANCNDSNNLLETAKWVALLHNFQTDTPDTWIGPGGALSLATSRGADAIGLGETVGKIAAGFAADITFFRLAAPAFVPLSDPVRQLVLSENGSAIDRVMVAGRTVFRKSRCACLDEGALWAEAQDIADRRKGESRAVLAVTKALEAPIRRMRARLGSPDDGGCSCH
jgi:5-methylthioadenosine/S-adenosylhomocysteine deaminase